MTVAVLICFMLPDFENLPCQPPPILSRDGILKAGSLTKGVILAGMVQKGMTHEQVQRLLGEPSFRAVDGGGPFESYHRYNIQVFWSNQLANGKYREPPVVDEVRLVWAWE